MTVAYPVYILSRGRADYGGHLAHYLNKIRLNEYSIVIEDDEYDDYARVFGERHLLVLNQSYKDTYETGDDRGDALPKGSGPARNFVWDHAAERDESGWHWLFDDNIRSLMHLHRNGDRLTSRLEWFNPFDRATQMIHDLAVAAPIYHMWRVPGSSMRDWSIAHTMSAHLIRNDLPIRWECRYNEDIDLSLRLAKRGWIPLRLNTHLISKVATQTVKGGNTDSIYTAGTAAKTAQLVARHPEYVKPVWRYGRQHHVIDWPKVITDHGLKVRIKADA